MNGGLKYRMVGMANWIISPSDDHFYKDHLQTKKTDQFMSKLLLSSCLVCIPWDGFVDLIS